MLKWFIPFAVTAAAVGSHAQTISFTEESGSITALTLQDIMLNSTGNYTSSSIQFRIDDLFPADTPFSGTFFDPASVQFEIGGVQQALASGGDAFGITSQQGAGAPEPDAFFWITFENQITLAPGDVITLSGNTLATSHLGTQLAQPVSGTYDAYFVSSGDGTLLSNTVIATVGVIPEPSTYAALLGAGALGSVLLRRRSRKTGTA